MMVGLLYPFAIVALATDSGLFRLLYTALRFAPVVVSAAFATILRTHNRYYATFIAGRGGVQGGGGGHFLAAIHTRYLNSAQRIYPQKGAYA